MGGREVSCPYRVWFFAEGERFLSFWRCHRPPQRGRWHRQKAVFYVFVSVPQYFSTEPILSHGAKKRRVPWWHPPYFLLENLFFVSLYFLFYLSTHYVVLNITLDDVNLAVFVNFANLNVVSSVHVVDTSLFCRKLE